MYPTTMLNVAVNYREHDIEMAGGATRRRRRRRPAPRCRARRARPASGSASRRHALEPVHVLQVADDRAPTAKRCACRSAARRSSGSASSASSSAAPATMCRSTRMDYVFGYTLENDMSDRGGRGDTRYGSDWLIGRTTTRSRRWARSSRRRSSSPNPQNLQ